MNVRNTITFSTLAIFCLTLSFAAGYATHAYLNPPNPEFPVLTQAYSILRDHAYDDLPEPPSLEYGMIRGMLQTFNDPHTIFVEPVQHELDRDSLQGSFGGIGVRLEQNASGAILLFPFPEGPAAQAGIRDGDVLLQVDNLAITPETRVEASQAAIRGRVGEEVTLSVRREPGGDLLTFRIRRAIVPLPSVTWHLAPGESRVGVIEINLLAASTPDEVVQAVTDLQNQGAGYFILDMRDNNGGLLDAGIKTARLFLEDGAVLEQQYRGQKVETYQVDEPGPLVGLPLAVLINHNTASAAEIVAGAIQRHNRAPLIGAPSYGKDSIQLVFDLDDGSSLHVTAARWWIPGLAFPLGDSGLQPTFPVLPEEAAINPDVTRAIQVLLEGGQ